MKSIDFLTLYDTDYNLDNLCSLKQIWENDHIFRMTTPRPTSAFVFTCGVDATYWNINNTSQKLFVPKNSIVYIPEGSTYESKFYNCSTNGTPCDILIEFNLIDNTGSHFNASDTIIMVTDTTPLLTHLFREISELYLQTVLPLAAMKSTLYKILSELSQLQRHANIYSKEFASVADGILYMESGVNPNRSIEDIARMCHVSPACFRRLFKKYSGMSPVEYRTYSKITYAKKLLQSKTFSIAEIAEELQYETTAYFCRVFKKETGLTPSEYSKMF